jgi:hypothetical protein
MADMPGGAPRRGAEDGAATTGSRMALIGFEAAPDPAFDARARAAAATAVWPEGVGRAEVGERADRTPIRPR